MPANGSVLEQEEVEALKLSLETAVVDLQECWIMSKELFALPSLIDALKEFKPELIKLKEESRKIVVFFRLDPLMKLKLDPIVQTIMTAEGMEESQNRSQQVTVPTLRNDELLAAVNDLKDKITKVEELASQFEKYFSH